MTPSEDSSEGHLGLLWTQCLDPQRTNPSKQTHSLESQVPYLEGPFPLGELLLILQDPAQVFPLLRSFP